MREDMTFVEIYKLFRKHLWKVLASTVLGVIVAILAMHYLTEPLYSSQAQLLVNQGDSIDTMSPISEVEQNIQMINTYRDILLGDAVLGNVAQTLDNQYSVGELRDGLTFRHATNSQAFNVGAIMNSPELAQTVVDEVIQEFDQKIKSVYGEEESSIHILSQASYNPNPVSPSVPLFIILGLAFGLLIGGVLATLIEMSNTTVTSDDEFLEQLNLMNLGTIDELSNRELNNSRLKITVQNYRLKRKI